MSKQKTDNKKSNTESKTKTNSKSQKSKGLGDTIEMFTKATGIKSIVGECGGCAKRREKLNKMFSYVKEKTMTPDEVSVYEHHRESVRNALREGRVNTTVQRPIVMIYNKVIKPQPQAKVVTCSACFQKVEDMFLQLEEIYMNTKIKNNKKKDKK